MDFFKNLREKFQKPQDKPTLENKTESYTPVEEEKKRSNEEVMESLDKRFLEDKMDLKSYLIEGIPKSDNMEHWIEEKIKDLKESQSVIATLLNDKVMSNYDSFGKKKILNPSLFFFFME